ncbi:MAG: hypothetical protein A2Z14_04345 [Chloroflexi bacterium RBG_16_48_8]|nr:MAG: hypothetical protein A2Z14_04345 [Chloroflexi bacterium RBG_16_48_8]
MNTQFNDIQARKTTHSWLKKIHIYPVLDDSSHMVERVAEMLLDQFHRLGHDVQAQPDHNTDILLTNAIFNEPIDWRKALLFTSRLRFNLDHTPTIFTLILITAQRFRTMLDHFKVALSSDNPDPNDFKFPGLAPQAYKVLIEQGHRGGPILALERLIQAQAKSIRILLVVGDENPVEAYLFDLVGAHPCIPANDLEVFYNDILLHMVTAVSTHEVTNHKVIGKPIRRSLWEQSTAVKAMRRSSLELSKRNFFTPMVRIADLVEVPAVGDVIASQYSEGCFSTWDPKLNALIATVTGSARPVDKSDISDDDLAVIVGMQPDGSGALVCHVEGKRNDPPSSEAVEMMDMDNTLPRITLGSEWEPSSEVPVVRSKLHGHRGVASFDSRYVEHVFLDPPYYHYPVSCATEAQARAIRAAFSRSEALQNPQDPRQVVFTILPGHGTMIVEKWVQGKDPFQVIWEYMDSGFLEVEKRIPQGPLAYIADHQGRMILQAL